jgi:eukaryotic-like serine/threonine-protein kinase
VPGALAALVMRCLEKQPANRPADGSELVRRLDAVPTSDGAATGRPDARGRTSRAWPVGAAVAAVLLAAAALAGALGVRRQSAPARGPGDTAAPASLAVLSFENASGDTAFAYFAEGLSDEVRGALTEVPGLAVKARTSSAQFRGRDVDPRAVGARLGVGAVLSGVVRRSARGSK